MTLTKGHDPQLFEVTKMEIHQDGTGDIMHSKLVHQRLLETGLVHPGGDLLRGPIAHRHLSARQLVWS